MLPTPGGKLLVEVEEARGPLLFFGIYSGGGMYSVLPTPGGKLLGGLSLRFDWGEAKLFGIDCGRGG